MKTCFRFIVFCYTIICVFSASLQGQWHQTSGPGGSYVTGIGIIGNELFATTTQAANGSGIWYSSNEGLSWEQRNNGFESPEFTGPGLLSITVQGNDLYVTEPGRAYRSTDKGNSWTTVSTNGYTYSKIFSHNGVLYGASIGTASRIYRSTNNGASWDIVLENHSVYDFAAQGTTLYAGTNQGVVRSTNNGIDWSPLGTGFNKAAQSIVVVGNRVLVGTGSHLTPGNGFYRFNLTENTWTGPIMDSLTLISHIAMIATAQDTTLFATLFLNYDRGVFRSTDQGLTWQETNNGLTNHSVLAFAVADSKIYAGTYSSGIFISTDKGTTWHPRQHKMIQTAVYSLVSKGNFVFAGTYLSGGLYRTTDNGTTWSESNDGFGIDSVFLLDRIANTLLVTDSAMFAGVKYNGIYRSTDNGQHWIQTGAGMDKDPQYNYVEVKSITRAANGATNFLFAGTSGEGIYRSSNSGVLWEKVNNGITNLYINTMLGQGGIILAGTGTDLYRSTNFGTNWKKIDSGMVGTEITSLAVLGTFLFAGTTSGIYKSTDNGISWQEFNNGYPGGSVISFVTVGTNMVASVASTTQSIIMSSDTGKTWAPISSGVPIGYAVWSLAANTTHLFAAIGYMGVWKRPLSEILTTVQRFTSATPNGFRLDQNYPNPFNPETTISFSLPSQSFVVMKVYDVLGRDVSSIVSEELIAGEHSRVWYANGLTSGVYYCTIQAGPFRDTKKLLLLK